MAKTDAKTKTNPGRKRKHPEGSLEFRFRLAPEEVAALEEFRKSQLFPPDTERMFATLVRKFLVESGFLKS